MNYPQDDRCVASIWPHNAFCCLSCRSHLEAHDSGTGIGVPGVRQQGLLFSPELQNSVLLGLFSFGVPPAHYSKRHLASANKLSPYHYFTFLPIYQLFVD